MISTRVEIYPELLLPTAILIWVGMAVARAEVALDGSLGPSGELNGPDVTIPDNVGKTVGSNLFHSFSEFNLRSSESATFTGPATIENILSRVTGGNPSEIDGLLRSTIADANLFFLNPAGVMFGPNASLDVQGSFHVTTADYIRLEDGTHFYGEPTPTGDALLTTASPEAFGFLDDKPSAISFDRSNLSVPAGETVSVIGGKLTIAGQEQGFPSFDNFPLETQLKADSGRINLASTASGGEIAITADDLDVSSLGELGEIEIKGGALVDVSGTGGGKVIIRSGTLTVDNSLIQANTTGSDAGAMLGVSGQHIDIRDGRFNASTYGTGTGGGISIHDADSVSIDGSNRGDEISVFFELNTASGLFAETFGKDPNAGNGGPIDIEAARLELLNGALVKTSTSGVGRGGDVTLDIAESLVITGQNSQGASTAMLVNSSGDGNAGKLNLSAGNMLLTYGAAILTGASGNGSAGTVSIDVQGDVELSGAGQFDNSPSWISTSSSTSDAGDITLIAQNLRMKDGALIDTSTFLTGNAGDITLVLSEQLQMSGESVSHVPVTSITASTVGSVDDAGTGGIISIAAENTKLSDGAQINSITQGSGAGSDIRVATNVLSLSGASTLGAETSINTTTNSPEQTAGRAGDIFVTASKRIDITSGAKFRAESKGAGDGGDLNINSPEVTLYDQSNISTLSETANGDAGNITLSNLDRLRLDQSSIRASTEAADGGNINIAARTLVDLNRSSITASVGGGAGSGGNITIDPEFIVLNLSEITADAKKGPGGDITITAGQFIASPDSRLRASSELNIDGKVVINAPIEDVSSQLAEVRVDFFDVAKVLSRPCADRSGADVIGLSNAKYDLLPESPYGLRTHIPDTHRERYKVSSHVDLLQHTESDPRLVQPGC